MKKLGLAVFVATLALSATAQTQDGAAAAHSAAVAGKMLYTAQGQRLASVYHVAQNGSAEVILDGKLVIVPAETISDVDGKLQTSLSKSDLKSHQ